MKRVLKPRGKLYIADIADSWLVRLVVKVWNLFMPSLDKWNIYSESQFKEFLEAEFSHVYQQKGSWIHQLSGERVLLTVGTKKKVRENA
jgi:ubiquinone/menaquinone biosynthesis C-methylase UbiE